MALQSLEPAIAAITYANIDNNLHLLQAGQHADKVITSGTQMFIVTMGGTGATLDCSIPLHVVV